MGIHSALEQALKALELLNDGHTYNEHDPKDPLRCAKDKIEKFVPKTVSPSRSIETISKPNPIRFRNRSGRPKMRTKRLDLLLLPK